MNVGVLHGYSDVHLLSSFIIEYTPMLFGHHRTTQQHDTTHNSLWKTKTLNVGVQARDVGSYDASSIGSQLQDAQAAELIKSMTEKVHKLSSLLQLTQQAAAQAQQVNLQLLSLSLIWYLFGWCHFSCTLFLHCCPEGAEAVATHSAAKNLNYMCRSFLNMLKHCVLILHLCVHGQSCIALPLCLALSVPVCCIFPVTMPWVM